MSAKIFVNLPVKDLSRSIGFFQKIGFTFNPQFTDDKAACMVVSDDIYVMLLVESYFQRFARRDVADATRSNEVITALGIESREQVDQIADRAVAEGAEAVPAADEQTFMHVRTFRDLDGHLWELMHLDTAAAA